MATKDISKENKNNKKLLTILLALLVTVLWLAIFILLIKIDVGGFGSGVLRPILKDVPVLNLILPEVSDKQLAKERGYKYSSISKANERIDELEQTLADVVITDDSNYEEKIADLEAEINRLKKFEENEEKFKKRQEEFDKNVVFAENAPDIDEYKKFYEGIDPTNAENIYRQVVEQLQHDSAILEKADIYKNMDHKAAANILEAMSDDLEIVVRILQAMKPKESAIMAEMDSAFAAKNNNENVRF